ncbi:LytTR family transcriptional regulator DNA-binding domain-containing protein [Pedobacter glucosidilyticus]|uniref:LytTR family transcriptional regulator DNA-binding domain-containing protein n=1 Tax=Pedobacter glucosidilyticus TaxID=1122941 RepID=UPI0026E9FC72|nr:LytTR family transcriptional regulator DNA-binding domain-containing protein [Pedobacter glucosidilyticus]
MKQKSLFFKVKPGKYFHWHIRLLLAVIISHYLIVIPQTKPVWQIMQQLNYYVAMLYSIGVAFSIIQITHSINHYLDSRISWEDNWVKRLSYQCFFGLFCVLVLNYLAIRLYFWTFDNDFDVSGYMQTEFQIVVWMLLSLNFVYAISYFIRLFQKQSISIQVQSQEPIIEGSLGNKVFKIAASDIIAIIKKGNVGTIYTKDCKRYNNNDTIQSHLQRLGDDHFFQINRSEIYARSIIVGYERMSNYRGRLYLNLKMDDHHEAIVARHRLKQFLKWYDGNEQ